MPVSYKDLKDKSYLNSTKSFVESHLGIHFISAYGAHCPFHHDRKDSFRIRVSKAGEVRFHCFGACEKDWDIYDLIMLKEGCSFRQAQETFAKSLGVEIEDFQFHKGRTNAFYKDPEGDVEEPIVEADTADLTNRHREALQHAAHFYNSLLTDSNDKFQRAWTYLRRRQVDEESVKRFQIGFCPPLEDKEYRGRALLNADLDKFIADFRRFHDYYRASIFRLLNDLTTPAYSYYRNHIDFGAKHPYGVYADYFAGRITFPIFREDGQIEGMIGRRLDNRGVRWTKQSQEDSVIQTKGWLYGIDKSATGIKEYQTAIIVEGIFDFFAFYNISENKEKPIVISTLGTRIDDSAIQLLKELGAKHLIVAFDWDEAGIRGIQRAAAEIEGLEISFLGSLKEGEDPADRLKGVLSKVSNFAIRHLQRGMQVKHPSGKPVGASILIQRGAGKKVATDHVLLKPAAAIGDAPPATSIPEDKPRHLWYRIDKIIHLLSYNHKNRAELQKTLQQILSLLSDPKKAPPPKEDLNQFFHLPIRFIEDEHHLRLGDALILHLRLAIEQQTKKRKGGLGGRIKESDSTIARWLHTSTRTIQRYKGQLKEAGLLNIEIKGVAQELSVRYYAKPEAPITPTLIT
jgi:DNA primase catalytic core